MSFQMSKRSFDETVQFVCQDAVGLELHNMAVVAIMQDGLDTANRHASSSAVWLLCRATGATRFKTSKGTGVLRVEITLLKS